MASPLTTLFSTSLMNTGSTEPPVPYWNVPGRVLLSLTMIVIMSLAIFGNGMVILVIARNHGMRTRTNFFLMNLAIADFLCGCIDMPFSLITVIRGEWIFHSNPNVCQMNSFFTPFFFVASIHTLMYIAVFKYLSIHNPLKFTLSRLQILLMIGAAWAWAAIIGILSVVGLSRAAFEAYTTQCGPTYDENFKTHSYVYFSLLFVTCYAIPLCVVIFCYVGMFREIRSHGRRLRETSTFDREKIYAQQRGILVTLLVVIAAFVITWTPWIVYSLYAILSGDNQSHWANPILFWFGYANSACNPIIYALRSQTFREGYKQVVAKRNKNSGYQVGTRSSGGTHYWNNDTQSSFMHRQSTREKSKSNYIEALPVRLPVRRRLSSGESLPEGFITHHEKIVPQHIPLSTMNVKPFEEKEPLDNRSASAHQHGSMRVPHRESTRTRHPELGLVHPQNLGDVPVEKVRQEAVEKVRVGRIHSNRHKKATRARKALAAKQSVREVQGLAPNLKKWIISRELGRPTENPDVIEVYTDVNEAVELQLLNSSSKASAKFNSNMSKEYSQSVCSLCSNPDCEFELGQHHHHKRSPTRHVKKSKCKQKSKPGGEHQKTQDNKHTLYRLPSIDELDQVVPKRHVAPSNSVRHQNPLTFVEKWYHKHRKGAKPNPEDIELGEPLNRNSSMEYDHVAPGMFRSSSAPCL